MKKPTPFPVILLPWASILAMCGASSPPPTQTPAEQAPTSSMDSASASPLGNEEEAISPEARKEAHALYNVGLELKRDQQFEKALVELDAAIKLHPEFAAAHFSRGSVLKAMGRMPEATEAFRQARILKPTHQNAWAMEGATLLRQEKYKEAIAPLTQAVDMSGKDADSVMNLGIALKHLGRTEEAIKVYERGLKDMPGNPGILNNLGILLASLKRYEETVVYLEDALETDPENTDLQLNMATTLRQAKRFGEAIVYYEKVVAKQPGNAGALYDLGYCYERDKKPKEAIRIYKQYVNAVKETDPAAAKRTNDLINRMKKR